MFGHQSLLPRNNTASHKFPQGKLYNLRLLSWWNLFFWASFFDIDVCDHWIEVWSKFLLFHWKRNNLLWTNFIINWSHVRILLAICESKFPPPWITSPPPLRALRLPQWERPLCLTNVSIKALKWSMPFNSEIPKLLRTDLKTYWDRCKVHPGV